jgi:phage shock protein C
MNRRLHRSQTESVIAGVAGGVAEYLDLDPAIVRVIWALLAIITGGVFFVLYIVMWVVVPLPDEPADGVEGHAPVVGADPVSGWNAQPRRPQRRSGSGSWVFGLILIGLGLYFLAREYLPSVNFDRLWPLGLVLLGVVLLFGAIRRRPA